MSVADTVKDLNRELARRINQDARSNLQSPYVSKFVGIANGQVVAVADDLEEMTRQLRQAQADPRQCFWVEASRDYDEVHEIASITATSAALVCSGLNHELTDRLLALAGYGQPTI